MDLPDIPVRTDYEGPYGKMEFIDHDTTNPLNAAGVCCYLITAPAYHPVWSQYMLGVVDLKDHDGLPDPKLHFDGATHELMVVALNPDYRQDKASMLHHAKEGTLPFLLPVNIAHQFTASDEEMEAMAWLCGNAITEGRMDPEVGDAPELVREGWLAACVKTLAHFRGEVHQP